MVSVRSLGRDGVALVGDHYRAACVRGSGQSCMHDFGDGRGIASSYDFQHSTGGQQQVRQRGYLWVRSESGVEQYLPVAFGVTWPPCCKVLESLGEDRLPSEQEMVTMASSASPYLDQELGEQGSKQRRLLVHS